MATVYRVRDTRLRISRALKLLDPELSVRPGLRQRFEVEAHAMAKLSHPNIVRVFDVVDDGVHFYIVMELIEGPTVIDKVDEGPLDLEPALRITKGVLAALEAAHAANIIHRDIKPHNLLLFNGESSEVRVSDFGIAQCGDFADRSITKTGAVMGTWAFMAPEQRADAKGVDPRADIYSVGATLFAMVTGLTPPDLFAADIDPVMFEDVPKPVREIVRKATRYWSWERYGSARVMRHDIELVLERVIQGDGFAGLDLRLKEESTPEAPPLAPEPVALDPVPPLPRSPPPRARTVPPSPARPRSTLPAMLGGLVVVAAIAAWFILEPLFKPGAGTVNLGTESADVSEPVPPAAAAPQPTAVVPSRPVLKHAPPVDVSLHEQVALLAVVDGSQAYDKVTAYFRPVGVIEYRSARMNRAGNGYRGYLPMDRTMKRGLEYYIEARSYASSNPVLLSASARRPHRLIPAP
jgi:serine/threonine protein kinase